MSILSFPDRGHWGNAKWRGNCSGHVYKELFERLQPKVFIDPMVGSGTSVEVAHEMGIEAYGLDLHSGFNCLRDSILGAVGKPGDLVVSHPPYGGMIKYSGSQWGDSPHPDDLSHCISDEDFNAKLQLALLNQREATIGGGYYGTLIGDWRHDGRYISYQAEAIARMPADELAGVIIKAQHNVMSGSKSYGRMKLPMIMHEYLILWRKPETCSVLVTLTGLAKQQYARLTGTWRNIVKLALMALGGKADTQTLYAQISASAPDRLTTNPNWKAKIRQTLQLHEDLFRSDERGVWQIAEQKRRLVIARRRFC